MTRSQLIHWLTSRQTQLDASEMERTIRAILSYMTDALANGDRVEIRGFGSFSLRHRLARTGRNPKTGTQVQVQDRYVPHFKPGKLLRDNINEGKDAESGEIKAPGEAL